MNLHVLMMMEIPAMTVRMDLMDSIQMAQIMMRMVGVMMAIHIQIVLMIMPMIQVYTQIR